MKKVAFIFVLVVVIFFSCVIFSGESLAVDTDIVGTIEIPKINLNYTISSKVTTDSLNKNIVFLYGEGINKVGNSVLIGHNYRNGQFFSDINKLENDDYIYLIDTENNKVGYKVYNIFEASASDTSFYQRDTSGKREVMLSTVSNTNVDNRLIVVAKESSDVVDDLQNAEKNAFNIRFEKYEGIQRGSVIKNLIQEISVNNADSNSRIIKINVDSADIETSSKYRVKFNYDENGYVKEVLVEKEVQDSESPNNVDGNSNKDSKNINSSNSRNDVTTSKGTLPKAGRNEFVLVGIIFMFLIVAIIFDVKAKKYENIV